MLDYHLEDLEVLESLDNLDSLDARDMRGERIRQIECPREASEIGSPDSPLKCARIGAFPQKLGDCAQKAQSFAS